MGAEISSWLPFAFLRRPAGLPLLLLLLSLSTVFLFGNDRGYFYRPGNHDWTSSDYLTAAVGLSPEQGFLLFRRQILEWDGAPGYVGYNRYPFGGYVLTKLATMPFHGDLSAQLYVARMLTLLSFCAAALMAWLALRRLSDNGWIALTATLVPFSSSYCLYYNDMISCDLFSLFGVMLCFHGMVVFIQEGRFRQLLLKTAAALLLGWHVFALLLPFILFGLVRELRQRRPGRLWAMAGVLAHSRYLRLGVASLLFGSAILAFQFTNEYRAYGGKRALSELPSVQSMQYRMGMDEELNLRYAAERAWPHFLEDQIFRIGGLSIPYSLPSYANTSGEFPAARPTLAGVVREGTLIGAAVLLAALIGLLLARRHRLLLGTLMLCGFFWCLPMRNSTTWHEFESLHYLGIPLVFYCLLLQYLRGPTANRLFIILSGVACLFFALSAYRMGQVGYGDAVAERQRAIVADFEAIRRLADGKAVSVDFKDVQVPFGMHYYLAGRNIKIAATPAEGHDFADYVVAKRSAEGPAPLTPQNRHLFLYERSSYEAGDQLAVGIGDPAARSVFDIFLEGNALIYVKNPCRKDDIAPRFFLHVAPIDKRNLADDRTLRFNNLDFNFEEFQLPHQQGCVASVPLPDYGIEQIRTGQFSRTGEIWSAEIGMVTR